jgi:pimeloyl-ACP methyl ester carboxylesterase
VLIVRGTRSTSFSAETARQMLATLPHAELIELDSAHNVALEQPRALANAVVDFARVL